MQTQKPILFTGAFCSNQEWIEPILSVFPLVHYLPHFFSPHSDAMEIFSFEKKFPFIAPKEDNPYAPFIAEFFGYKTGQENTKTGNSFKQLYHRFVDKYQINKDIKKKIRPLIYDKHGIFLAEWLSKHYQADIIILIQHPLHFVYQWIENKESMDFDKLFLPKLTNYAPNTFERVALEKQENRFQELQDWEKALRIWLIFAETILYYQLNYPDWLFFRYEDFREKPERTLTDICDMLDLNYTKEFLKKFEETSEMRTKDAKRLNPDYLKALINETQEYLTHFYPRNVIGKSMFR
ncbi:MAG: hypothetical protein COZ18_12225 [Flexibacter sp. CG_4_10_14_3_um_filter_32_15]|nr:MAG: hypothetical protein COZ18_12225 [Flexibacter sp. CG_4_10_14_3_um_filter_32_15]